MSQRRVSWVIKTSKLCNLRCAYCYEFNDLGDPTRISLADFRRLFSSLGSYYEGRQCVLDFVWHGGEPLIVPPRYYLEIQDLQHELLAGKDIAYTNSTQTNLVRLNGSAIGLMHSFFDRRIGVSVDPVSDERVDLQGRQTLSRVVKNMETLRQEGIKFSCITVLSRHNQARLIELLEFFENLGVPFRLLPIYRHSFPGQQDLRALDPTEVAQLFRQCVDFWLRSESPTLKMQPIQDFISIALRYRNGDAPIAAYDKRLHEEAFILDVTGDLYSVADAYDRKLMLGNIFSATLESILTSEEHARVVHLAEARMSATCHHCSFFGSCRGSYMAEATVYQRHTDQLGRLNCGIVEPVVRYIDRRLSQLADRVPVPAVPIEISR